MVQPGDFGVVRVIGGEHAGSLGYYDDDDAIGRKDRAIVYLGTPGVPGAVNVMLRYRDLAKATSDEKIQFEMEHLAALPPALRDRAGYHP